MLCLDTLPPKGFCLNVNICNCNLIDDWSPCMSNQREIRWLGWSPWLLDTRRGNMDRHDYMGNLTMKAGGRDCQDPATSPWMPEVARNQKEPSLQAFKKEHWPSTPRFQPLSSLRFGRVYFSPWVGKRNAQLRYWSEKTKLGSETPCFSNVGRRSQL